MWPLDAETNKYHWIYSLLLCWRVVQLSDENRVDLLQYHLTSIRNEIEPYSECFFFLFVSIKFVTKVYMYETYVQWIRGQGSLVFLLSIDKHEVKVTKQIRSNYILMLVFLVCSLRLWVWLKVHQFLINSVNGIVSWTNRNWLWYYSELLKLLSYGLSALLYSIRIIWLMMMIDVFNYDDRIRFSLNWKESYAVATHIHVQVNTLSLSLIHIIHRRQLMTFLFTINFPRTHAMRTLLLSCCLLLNLSLKKFINLYIDWKMGEWLEIEM